MNMYHIYDRLYVECRYNINPTMWSLVAIPILLICIVYILFLRNAPSSPAQPKPTPPRSKVQDSAELKRSSLEQRVRRRMGKSS